MALIAEGAAADPAAIPDERLRLIFACCHPALEEKTRVALTLRRLCGLSTAEVARVFRDAKPTIGQRLSRARAKITTAGIPFAVPPPEHWAERLNSVLTVIFLIFTTGYAQGPATGTDLCHEAIFLARLMLVLAPDHAETEGALALLLVTQARAGGRFRGRAKPCRPMRRTARFGMARCWPKRWRCWTKRLPGARPGRFRSRPPLPRCMPNRGRPTSRRSPPFWRG